MIRGIRGAITVAENSENALREATKELLTRIIEANDIRLENVAYLAFSATEDLDCAFPARFAREISGFELIPMECYQEMRVKSSLALCLRLMMAVNTEKPAKEIKHVYLKGAASLRPDIK